jgi:hypothetical protein
MDTSIRIAPTDQLVLVQTNPDIKVVVDGEDDLVVSTEVAGMRGPEGGQGIQGPPGVAGDGATDPGDLTLIFDNKLL